jgi:nucleotide-binding universal stress UspA family protein
MIKVILFSTINHSRFTPVRLVLIKTINKKHVTGFINNRENKGGYIANLNLITMKILVPTDFSKNAEKAIEYAAVIAKSSSAAIELLHVYTEPVTRNNIAYPLIFEETAWAVKTAREQIEKRCAEISAEKGIPCEGKVKIGATAEEIIKEADASQVDFIVVGTKGASGLDKVLFGSTTTSVIEKAPCPVLSVPMDAAIAPPKKIVFATNYHEGDMKALKKLTKFGSFFNAELIVLHVSKENLKSERDLVEQFSKAVAKESGSQQPYYYALPHENTEKGINLFIDSSGADLIALSTRKRTVFEKMFDPSLAKKLAYQARLPLLAFHAGGDLDGEG